MVHHQGGEHVAPFPPGGHDLDVMGHPVFVGEAEVFAVLKAAPAKPGLRRQQPGLAVLGLELEIRRGIKGKHQIKGQIL